MPNIHDFFIHINQPQNIKLLFLRLGLPRIDTLVFSMYCKAGSISRISQFPETSLWLFIPDFPYLPMYGKIETPTIYHALGVCMGPIFGIWVGLGLNPANPLKIGPNPWTQVQKMDSHWTRFINVSNILCMSGTTY